MADEEKQKTEQGTEGATGQKAQKEVEGKTVRKTEQGAEQKGTQGNEQARIAELQGLLTGKTEELTKAGKHLAELERTAAEAGDRAGKLDGSLKQAVISYRTLITKANPDVLPEMLTGESVEELDSSLGKARELISKIKNGLQTQSQAARVPAGAPQRGAPDMSGLSSREKIRLGLERAGK